MNSMYAKGNVDVPAAFHSLSLSFGSADMLVKLGDSSLLSDEVGE